MNDPARSTDAPPRATVHPLRLVVAAGFQKIVEASLHGDAVFAKARLTAQDPISFRPNACARSVAGTTTGAAANAAEMNNNRVAR